MQRKRGEDFQKAKRAVLFLHERVHEDRAVYPVLRGLTNGGQQCDLQIHVQGQGLHVDGKEERKKKDE